MPKMKSIESVSNIIVRMPNWLGDFCMALPILTDLKNHFKSAKLTALVKPSFKDLLDHHPSVDETLTYEKKSSWLRSSHKKDLIKELKRAHYDLGILLTNSFSSALLFKQAKIKQTVGFRGSFRSCLLTHPLSFPKNRESMHQVRLYKELLTPLSIPISGTKPELTVTEEQKNEAQNQLKLLGIDPKTNILIGITPSAAFGSSKCWPPEKFSELIHKLLKDSRVRILLLGDKSAEMTASIIAAPFYTSVINLTGKTSLKELMHLLSCVDLLLCNDSGPMHMQDALGGKLLALFGSTNDKKTGPYNQRGAIINKRVSCSPCYLRNCPIDFRCMLEISSDEVFERIKKEIDQGAK